MAIELDDLQIEIVANADQATKAIVEVANALKKAGNSSKAMNKLAEALHEVSTEAQSAADSTEELGEVASEATTESNKGFKAMVDALKSAGNGVKALGNGLKGVVVGGFSKISNLISQIRRVAFYRLIRSAIKLITSSLSEGVKTLIAWDREWGNNSSLAAQTADTINAKWAEVKKSLGAAAMPLIQILQPALMSIMQTVIDVANTINMVLRSLQGYGTYMKATTQAIGDGLQTATGRAKELKRVLFGFDELNILPSDNGGGGGGTSATTSPIDFTETIIDDAAVAKFNEILDIVKAIGAGFLTWKVGSTFLKGLGLAGDKVTGLGLALAGAVTAGFALVDQLSDGVTWGNAATLMAGLTTMVVGLGKAFGSTGTAIGLITGGVVALIAPLKELIKTGNLTTASFVQLEAGIVAIGAGISILTGSVIPALIGLGIAGLVAGITYQLKEEKKAQDALEIEKYGAKIADMTSEIKANSDALRNRRKEILNTVPQEAAELQMADNLMKKYQELRDKEDLTADEKERLASLSGELVKLYPDLNGYINEENGLLDISAQEWQKIYDAKMKDIKLEARREKLIELYKAQFDAEMAVKDATEKSNKAYQVYQDTIARKNYLPTYISQMQNLLGKVNLSEKGVNDLTQSEKKLFYELTGGTMKTEDARQAIIDLTKEYYNSDKAIDEAYQNYLLVNGELDNLQKEYRETEKTIEDVSKGMYDDIKTNNDKTSSSFELTRNNIKRSIQNIQGDLKPINFSIGIDASGMPTTVGNIYATMQNRLLKTPLVMQVTSQTSGIAAGLLNSRRAIIATRFAEGGVPDIGTLFYAGEAGAEVVTNMNGRTQVLNAGQMSDAVANGNIDVVNAIYALMNTMVSTVNNKSFDVYMDASKVGRSVSNYQNNQARRGIAQGAY